MAWNEFQQVLLTSFPEWGEKESRTRVYLMTWDTIEQIQNENLGEDFVQRLKKYLPADATLYRPYGEPIKPKQGVNDTGSESCYIRFASHTWEIAPPGYEEPMEWIDSWQNWPQD